MNRVLRPDLEKIKFERIRGEQVSDTLLDECAALFSEHYGRWSESHRDPHLAGKPIRLPAVRLRSYLQGPDSWIATAREQNASAGANTLVGYAMAAWFRTTKGTLSWVTQLVVHTEHQNCLIGSLMLSSIWAFSNHFAWGIVSANPYAVRALEKATRRRCDPLQIARNREVLVATLNGVEYLRDRTFTISPRQSVVDTQFFQDLSTVSDRLTKTSRKHLWRLGPIREGEEWLAVTFHDQAPTRWTPTETETFLNVSDEITRTAYERMSYGRPEVHHGWARPGHADREIELLTTITGIGQGNKVLDFGCGSGRHAFAMGRRGISVVGIDFSKHAVEDAWAQAASDPPPGQVVFYHADCRTWKGDSDFDMGLCLYDVIGSFPDDAANESILENLVHHVKPGGWVVLSVMSYEYTERVARYKVSRRAIDVELNKLPASDTMQRTGDVFDPRYLLLDTRNRIAYRKEMFDVGASLPIELVVRDRRYSREDITAMCGKYGLTVTTCGHVKAGQFKLSTDLTKEILVVAQKALL